MSLPHFLQLSDYSSAQLDALIERGIVLKTLQQSAKCPKPLSGKYIALLFAKPSTRTRLSFEIGVRQLGGDVVFLTKDQMQLGRGESPADTARVISSMTDAIVIRETDHETLLQFRDASVVPVINALSKSSHPCQLLADMQTYREHRGDIRGRIVVWLGDGNNMCYSYIEAAQQFGFQLRISAPEGFEPQGKFPECVHLVRDPKDAVRGAHLLVTDTWRSMGDSVSSEADKQKRHKIFAGHQLNRALLELADKDATYMHCLPAYRGQEISAELMDDPDTLIWDEAENRLHAQKALLEFVIQHTC